MKILLIEDEPKLAEYVEKILERDGHKVSKVESVEEAKQKGLEDASDLIILDLMLPGMQGDKYVERLRKQKNKKPVLVLSALTQIGTKVELLNLGVDDYMTKPFDERELTARVDAINRRTLEQPIEDEISIGDIKFYYKQSKVNRDGTEILLTPKESDLLLYLVENAGKTVRVDDLLLSVWNAKKGYHSNVVQATIKRLRKKLDDGFSNKLIRNVHGVGYILLLPNK